MELVYIVENYGKLTETFITDLIDALGRSGIEGGLLVDRTLDADGTLPAGLKLRETRFVTAWRRTAVWLGRIGKLLKRPGLRMRVQRWAAARALLPGLEEFRPRVSYIEYGNNAVLARSPLAALQIPFVVHFHGRDASALLGRPDYAAEIKKVFSDGARMIVPSHHLRRRLELAGCPAHKIRVVPHGINLARVRRADWAEKRRNNPSVIHVGRLTGKKNPLALLQAFRLVRDAVPRARLTMVGGGPLLEECRRRVKDLELADAVRLTGPLSHQEALAELQSHWVYAQHSVTGPNGDQEGFPVSILEAAASGLPVVSTLHSGIPESVVEGKTGFLVQEFDYESMAERITALLTDPELAERMGRAGRERVEANFRFSKRLEGVRSVLEEAADTG